MRAARHLFGAALGLVGIFFVGILLAHVIQIPGDVIVYSSEKKSGTQLRATDLRTRQTVVLISVDNPLAPAWSPDGCQIAYYTRSGAAPGELRLLSFGAASPTTLFDQNAGSFGPSEPDWSPDGSHLVFVSGDSRLQTLRLSDRQLDPLTGIRQGIGGPQWSPDGTKIVFHGRSAIFDTTGEQGRGMEIYVVGTNGGSLQDVSDDRAADTDPDWSPDGEAIAFISSRGGSSDVYIMRSNGSSARRITQDSAREATPRWSPDGRMLAFASDRTGQWQIYVISLEGAEQIQVTSDPATASLEPNWQPRVCRQG